MVRCSRPLTTYPARANRSNTLFCAISVAVEDEAWSDTGALRTGWMKLPGWGCCRDVACDLLSHPSSDADDEPPAQARLSLRLHGRSAMSRPSSGVGGSRRHPDLGIDGGPCLPPEVPRGVSRVSESCRGLSSGVCEFGSILSAR